MNFHFVNVANNVILYAITFIQGNQIFQYVSLALSVAYTIFSFLISFAKYKKDNNKEDNEIKNEKITKLEKIQALLKWGANALKDGKITIDEWNALRHTIINSATDNELDKEKDNEESDKK